MKYKISFTIVLFVFQVNTTLGFQSFDRRVDQAIQEIFESFPKDAAIQRLLGEHLYDYRFMSLIGTLMDKNTSGEFLPYIREYEALKSAPIRESIRIFHGSYLRGISLCRHPFIFVDMFLWQRLSEDEQKIVLFHELGHCDLMRGHEPSGTFSIMDEEGNFFTTIERINSETGQLEEIVVLSPRTRENLELLYRELFSKENNISDDIQLWIYEKEREGVDIATLLYNHFQSYFPLSLRARR